MEQMSIMIFIFEIFFKKVGAPIVIEYWFHP